MYCEPFKSNPLFHGYCGFYQYLLWDKEQTTSGTSSLSHDGDNQLNQHDFTDDSKDMDSSDDDASVNKRCETAKAKAYSKQALSHFDNLGRLENLDDVDLDYFVYVHHKV